MSRRLVTALASACVFLAAPSLAGAAGALDYGGVTTQSKPVKLEARATGRVKTLSIAWRAPCGDGALKAASAFSFEPGPATTGLTVEGDYRTSVGDGLTARIQTTGQGSLSSLHDRWSGRFRAKAVIFDKGERVTTCRTPRLGWTSKLRSDQYELTGQVTLSGDNTITNGETFTFDLAKERTRVAISGDHIGIDVADWSVRIGVPGGIDPGTYTVEPEGDPDDIPPPPRDATMSVSGNGSACDDPVGTFNVTQFAITRRVYDAEFTLEQKCSVTSAAEPLSGSVSIHRHPPAFETLKHDVLAAGTPLPLTPAG